MVTTNASNLTASMAANPQQFAFTASGSGIGRFKLPTVPLQANTDPAAAASQSFTAAFAVPSATGFSAGTTGSSTNPFGNSFAKPSAATSAQVPAAEVHVTGAASFCLGSSPNKGQKTPKSTRKAAGSGGGRKPLSPTKINSLLSKFNTFVSSSSSSSGPSASATSGKAGLQPPPPPAAPVQRPAQPAAPAPAAAPVQQPAQPAAPAQAAAASGSTCSTAPAPGTLPGNGPTTAPPAAPPSFSLGAGGPGAKTPGSSRRRRPGAQRPAANPSITPLQPAPTASAASSTPAYSPMNWSPEATAESTASATSDVTGVPLRFQFQAPGGNTPVSAPQFTAGAAPAFGGSSLPVPKVPGDTTPSSIPVFGTGGAFAAAKATAPAVNPFAPSASVPSAAEGARRTSGSGSGLAGAPTSEFGRSAAPRSPTGAGPKAKDPVPRESPHKAQDGASSPALAKMQQAADLARAAFSTAAQASSSQTWGGVLKQSFGSNAPSSWPSSSTAAGAVPVAAAASAPAAATGVKPDAAEANRATAPVAGASSTLESKLAGMRLNPVDASASAAAAAAAQNKHSQQPASASSVQPAAPFVSMQQQLKKAAAMEQQQTDDCALMKDSNPKTTSAPFSVPAFQASVPAESAPAAPAPVPAPASSSFVFGSSSSAATSAAAPAAAPAFTFGSPTPAPKPAFPSTTLPGFGTSAPALGASSKPAAAGPAPAAPAFAAGPKPQAAPASSIPNPFAPSSAPFTSTAAASKPAVGSASFSFTGAGSMGQGAGAPIAPTFGPSAQAPASFAFGASGSGTAAAATSSAAAAAPVFSAGAQGTDSTTPVRRGGSNRRHKGSTPSRSKHSSASSAAAPAATTASTADSRPAKPTTNPFPTAPFPDTSAASKRQQPATEDSEADSSRHKPADSWQQAAASFGRSHYSARRSPMGKDATKGSRHEAAAAPPSVPAPPPDPRAAHRAAAHMSKSRGNSAYQAENYLEAEKHYTEAITSLKLAQDVSTDMAVMYSNRAGARLMVGRPRSALEDAHKALAIDPKFLKAASRAATCQCRMGDFASARQLLERHLDRLSASSPHFQELWRKQQEVDRLAQAVAEVRQRVAEADAAKSAEAMRQALDKVNELHPQMAYCEVLAALRARACLQLGRVGDTLAALEVRWEAEPAAKAAPWRLWLAAQAQYHKGDMQAAVEAAEKLAAALAGRVEAGGPGSAVIPLPQAAAVQSAIEHMKLLLKLKEDGNADVKAGRHQAAVDKYSQALAAASPPTYAAILHSNRAAAHQALGCLMDAVADCARARALDAGYHKAHTRMASLLMELRRAEAAASLLDEHLKKHSSSSSGGSSSGGSGTATLPPEERSKLAEQLAKCKASASRLKTPDHYRMLGLERTCSEEDVRKAYRRAALKYHPDKALQHCKVTMALQGAAAGDGSVLLVLLGSELEARVREECAWLFTLITQAHEELGDKAKRRKVDQLLDAEAEKEAFAAAYGSSSSFSSRPYGARSYSTNPMHAGGWRYGTGAYGGAASSNANYAGRYGSSYSRPASGSSQQRAGAGSAAGAGAKPAGAGAKPAGAAGAAGSRPGAGGYSYGRTAPKWWEFSAGGSDEDEEDYYREEY